MTRSIGLNNVPSGLLEGETNSLWAVPPGKICCTGGSKAGGYEKGKSDVRRLDGGAHLSKELELIPVRRKWRVSRVRKPAGKYRGWPPVRKKKRVKGDTLGESLLICVSDLKESLFILSKGGGKVTGGGLKP